MLMQKSIWLFGGQMKIKKVLYIEDSITKYMEVFRYLKGQGITTIDWATDTEEALNYVQEAVRAGDPYDLLVSDMHFNYFGENDREAGEKTLKLLHEKGYDIPTIFCSSQNWKVPGS